MRRLATLTAVAALAAFGFSGAAMAQIEFADGVQSFAPGGGDLSGDDGDNGTDALGTPDGAVGDNTTFTSLGFNGGGGVLVLNFNDNFCLDDGTNAVDFTVAEIDGSGTQGGGTAELYDVSIGLQGGALTLLAATGNGVTSFDNEGIVVFNQIEIEATNTAGGTTDGADIDAVTCLFPAFPVEIDIKFCSNPNGFNSRRTRGKVPVTIFGTAALDVTTVDIDSLRLCEAADLTNCTASGPPSFSIADRGDPATDLGFRDDQCTADEGNPDGFDDLDVAFLVSEVCDVINCAGLVKGNTSLDLVVLGADIFSTNTDVLDIKR